MLVPSSTCPVKSGKEVFDHAECTEGVAATRVGYGHGMCAERDELMSEGTCVGGSRCGTYIISKHLGRLSEGRGRLSNRGFEDVREELTKHT